MDPVSLYAIISVPFGWAVLSKLQKGVIIFAAFDRYILFKLILSFCIGWAVTPFYVLIFGIKAIKWMFFSKKKNVANDNN